MKIRNTVWVQLHSTNTWLFTAPREETLHILCKDDKPRETQLVSTGLIKLAPGCDAISDNALLHSQSVGVVSIIDKNFVPRVNLSTDKLRDDIKKYNVNISELHLLNIGKVPRLDANLLKTASSSLSELYNEAEQIGKHHRAKTLYEKTTSWLYYIVYTIIGLVIIYFTLKCSLICKCFKILKLCCMPKEGCSQYFHNCFNTNVSTRDIHIPETPLDIALTTSSIKNTGSPENIELRGQIFNRDKNVRRSRSRNNRLYNL